MAEVARAFFLNGTVCVLQFCNTNYVAANFASRLQLPENKTSSCAVDADFELFEPALASAENFTIGAYARARTCAIFAPPWDGGRVTANTDVRFSRTGDALEVGRVKNKVLQLTVSSDDGGVARSTCLTAGGRAGRVTSHEDQGV